MSRITWVFLLFNTFLIGQNIIPNAGFEHYGMCPFNHSQINKATGWENPTKGSPDYYNACGNKDYSVPNNRYGKKLSFQGKAYAALNGRDNYREYIQIRLAKPLIKGQKYYCSIHISACESYRYVSSDIGLLFTKEKVQRQDYFRFKAYTPQIENHKDSIFTDYEWHEIDGYFIAKGGEQYLTIGSFKETVLKQKVKEDKFDLEPSWYNFIDNITTVPILRKKPKKKIQSELNKVENINFENKSSNLEDQSLKELKKVLKIMKRNPEITIKVIGHTDNIGSKSFNKNLSIDRCKAVKSHLIKKGVSAKRIIIEGKGDSAPVVENSSDENRQKNRRVEFKVL